MKVYYLLKKEMYSLFVSPIAYVVLTIYMILAAYFFVMLLFYSRSSDIIVYLFGNLTTMIILVSPILTMRLISEEKHSGTDEILLTKPIRIWEVVLGKYLAACLFYLVMLLMLLPFVGLVAWLGTPDYGPIISGFLGLFFVGSAFNAVGLFSSSLTRNQISASILSFGFVLMFWVIGWAGNVIYGFWQKFFEAISVLGHYSNFERGIISSTDVYFYLAFIFVFLYLTHKVLYMRVWK